MDHPAVRTDRLRPVPGTVVLLEAANGYGGPDPGAAEGARALRRSGLANALAAAGITVTWAPDSPPSPATPSDDSDLARVTAACHPLADAVAGYVSAGTRFAVIGGDHSIAVGTWSGARRGLPRRGQLGLLWIDAHMDSHVPATSPTGALHGMPLACLLGHGYRELCDLAGPAPALLPQHVCVVGVRSFEREEAELLGRLGVRVFGMREIADRGIGPVLEEALEIVSVGTAGFGVSVDLDAFDPDEAPGVSTPEPGGLRKAETLPALEQVRQYRDLVGVEVAELNPRLDDGRTARLAIDVLIACLPPEGTRQ